MILEQLDEISEMCEVYAEKHVKEENFKHHIGVYTQKIKIMKSIASWAATVQADDSAAQDLTHEGETRLQEMIDQSAKEQANMISERLEILKYVLDDPADLPVLLGGTEIRVELVFLSIAHLILGKHEEMMTSPKEELTDGSWEEMAETLDMLTDVFHDRMQELIRGWRNQKLQVELHITCFAGGIYAGWYTAFTDPKGEMRRILEKGGSVDEPEEGTQSNTAVLAEMQRLNDKVCQLDTRIDTIMSMLQTLLEANNIKHSHTPPKREKSPPPVLDVSISGGALLSSPLSGSPELPNPNAMGSVLAPYSADPFTVPSSVIHRPPFDGPTIVPKASPPRTNAEMKSPNGSQNSQHRVRRKPTIEYRDRKDDIDDIVDGYSKRGENKNNNHNNHNNSNNANVRVEGGIEFPKLTRVALHDRPMGSMTLDSAASSSQDEPGPMSPEQQPQTEPLPMVMGRHELSKDFYAQGSYSEGQSEATATVSDAWNSTGVEAANALGMDELTGGAFSGISASANMAMKMKKPSKANLKAAMGKMTGDGDTGIGAGIGASMGVGMGVGMGVPRPSVDENAKGISGAMKGLKSSVRSRLNSLTGKKSKDWDQSSDSHSHSAHPTSPPLPTSYSMPYRDYRDVYPQPSEHGHLPRSAPTTAPLSLGNGSGGRTPPVNNNHYNRNNNHSNHNPHENHHMSPSPPSSKPKDLRSHHPTESESHPYGYAYDGVDSPSWLSEPPSTRTFPHQPPSVSPRPRPPSGPRTRGLSMQNPNPPAVQNYTHTRRLAAGETGHQAGGASIKPRDNMF
ncbi:hypothetical protein FRC19_002981 [Serendipita sp. 401]|nr:hypothetical protein FRC19_002981 [Serendipita sp. 401]